MRARFDAFIPIRNNFVRGQRIQVVKDRFFWYLTSISDFWQLSLAVNIFVIRCNVMAAVTTAIRILSNIYFEWQYCHHILCHVRWVCLSKSPKSAAREKITAKIILLTRRIWALSSMYFIIIVKCNLSMTSYRSCFRRLTRISRDSR